MTTHHVTQDVAQSELTEPRKALDLSGARTALIAPMRAGHMRRGWKVEKPENLLGDFNRQQTRRE
jgi:hypothetical protein